MVRGYRIGCKMNSYGVVMVDACGYFVYFTDVFNDVFPAGIL